MEIIVPGTGCARCNSLLREAQKAIDRLGIEASITKEEDILKIMEYGVLRTPGLVIDGEIVSSGKVLTSSEIEKIIQKSNNL